MEKTKYSKKTTMKEIDKKFKIPDDKEVFFYVDLVKPENFEPDFQLKENEEFDFNKIDSDKSCAVNNPRDCLSLYTMNVSEGYVWKLRANSNASGRIGVTYGQQVGYGDTTTNTITIAPGQIRDLGYGQFGSGDRRRVWIISAWWD